MDPLEYLRTLRRRWYVIVGITSLALAAAWTTTPRTDARDVTDPVTTYQATHTIIVTERGYGSQNLGQTAFFVTVGDVPERVAQQLDGNAAFLANRIDVEHNSKLGTLQISATSRNPEQAEELANAFGTTLISHLEEEAVRVHQRQVDQTLTRLDELQGTVDDLDARLRAGAGSTVQAERDALVNQYRVTYERLQQLAASGPEPLGLATLAEATAVPVSSGGFEPPTGLASRLIMAVVLALVLSVTLVLVLDRLDTRLRTRDEVEDAFDLPVVAEVPRLSRADRKRPAVLVAERPGSALAEAYRSVRTTILLARLIPPKEERITGTSGLGQGRDRAATVERGNGIVVMVASADPSEGKTTTTTNLAASFAETGNRVLVVNADFRRPAVHAFLGVDDSEGLADHLGEDVTPPRLPDLAKRTQIPNVALVNSGDRHENPAILLAAMRRLLESARSQYDVIVVDTAPMLVTNDVSDLLPVTDVVVLTARAGKTPAADGERASETLRRAGAPVLGVILIGSQTGPGYKRGYQYYSSSKRDRRTPADEPVADLADAPSRPTPGERAPDERAPGDFPGDPAQVTASEPDESPRREIQPHQTWTNRDDLL